MSEVTLEIDGMQIKAEEGKTILEAAKGAAIHIPTLCYYPGLSPAGVCRLCSVEITRRGRKRIVTACCYPVEEGLVISTKSPEVIELRKMIIELMLTRCPNVKIIQDLAQEYGVAKPRFKLGDEKCILCGLCERVCNKIGKSVINFVGRGVDREVKTPYQISMDANLDFCMSCGACVSVCPTGAMEDTFDEITRKKPIPIPSEFEMGLTTRKPVYVPFPQAVPNIATIDPEECAHFATGECGICKEICGVDAIDFDQKEELIELNVGAIIIATGYNLFDAGKKEEYGYGVYDNVITGLMLERLLSASGPTGGHVIRPSDGKIPKRVAFLQCVGSRDEKAGNLYCSRVCCMYATKEAQLIKEHVHGADVTIYYMDIRAFGKGFEEFYQRAKKEFKIKYVKGRVAEILEDPLTKNLFIRAENVESGELVEEEVDMVVLSTGLVPAVTNDLEKALPIRMGDDGFFVTANPKVDSVSTSMEGVFTAGVAEGPKDIPDTVAQASAAAMKASILLKEKK